jgi:hypothetical protein
MNSISSFPAIQIAGEWTKKQKCGRNLVSKPTTIDRHLCKGQLEEEKYKDIAVVDYWWGLRELAAAFDRGKLTTASGVPLTVQQQKEFDYLQILHYTVYVKLAGAFHQLEKMRQLLPPASPPSHDFELRRFEAHEAFDALHAGLYQALYALTNQLFTLLNRQHHKPVTHNKQPKLTGLTVRNMKCWLNKNSHPDRAVLRRMLDNCNNQLDIRHHITHYGYVPTLFVVRTGNICIQRDFRTGHILTRFDLRLHADLGAPLVTILEASETRATKLCAEVDGIYKYIYDSNTFEDYMADRGLKLEASDQPYWERDNHLGTIDVSSRTGFTGGSAIIVNGFPD